MAEDTKFSGPGGLNGNDVGGGYQEHNMSSSNENLMSSSKSQSLFSIEKAVENGELPMDEDDEHNLPVGSADTDYDSAQVSIRALVTSKEAGIIIGKQGKNVAELRENLGIRAGVSKAVPGVNDRVVTVQGTLAGLAKSFELIASHMLENPPPHNAPEEKMAAFNKGLVTVRLLITHNQMGTVIGKGGSKIKAIQELSGARMVAQKDRLPQSTERVIEVSGAPIAIQTAVYEIGKCLIDDWERGIGATLYNPAVRLAQSNYYQRDNRYDNRYDSRYENESSHSRRTSGPPQPQYRSVLEDMAPEDIRTQNISIPADMVGCIIGRGGSKISEIRQKSGSRISIAKAAHDETGERMFTIQGSQESNEKALHLLYQQLEQEKYRDSSDRQN